LYSIACVAVVNTNCYLCANNRYKVPHNVGVWLLVNNFANNNIVNHCRPIISYKEVYISV
jgi:hypothetical protein